MKILRNARIIPELTPGFDGDRADIVIDGNCRNPFCENC